MMTLDQIRAQYVWNQLQHRSPAREYKNLAKSLPALIMSNGLMQTLAFLKGKDKDEHRRLIQDIVQWFADPGVGLLQPNQGNYRDAITRLSNGDSAYYQRATEEALAILKWIRFLSQTL
ncbi:MAG: type III-B CRISPR module-associated protein Cmr5 [Thermodesulfobacteriota bacterium]